MRTIFDYKIGYDRYELNIKLWQDVNKRFKKEFARILEKERNFWRKVRRRETLAKDF